jgi:hypothetical protein
MAEYIKFRLRAAKAGVTMAFLALLGGLAERASAERGDARARPASAPATWEPKLSLNGINGNLRTSLIKIDKDIGSVYDKDQKLLKLDIKQLSATFKTDYYSKDAANATFLTDKDATLEYLGKDAPAANSDKLGGLLPQAFVQGDGGISTGGATASLGGSLMPLLSSADGTLTVSVELTKDGSAAQIVNNGSSAIDWVSSAGTNGTINGAGKAIVPVAKGDLAGQVTIQFLPAVQSQAFTLILSAEPGAVGAAQSQRFVGQMINGDG